METRDEESATRSEVRIERLAWLACRNDMERRSQRWYESLTRIIGARGSLRPVSFAPTGKTLLYPSLGAELTRNSQRRRLAAFEFAVDDLARTLSPAEQADLRHCGTLPAGFVPAVLARAKKIRREMRASW